MEYNDVLTEFALYIEDAEATRAETRWDGDVLRVWIAHLNEEHLYTFCCADRLEAALETLASTKSEECAKRVKRFCYYVGMRSAPLSLEPFLFDDRYSDRGVRAVGNIRDSWIRFRRLLLDDSELGSWIRGETAASLISELQTLPRGDGPAHERLIKRIFQFCIDPYVRSIYEQQRTRSGDRRDLVLILNHHSEFFRQICLAGLRGFGVVVETKNQQKDSPADVAQLLGYLHDPRAASVGILITRDPASKAILDAPYLKLGGGTKVAIMFLDDSMLIRMLEAAGEGRFSDVDCLLVHQLHAAIYGHNPREVSPENP